MKTITTILTSLLGLSTALAQPAPTVGPQPPSPAPALAPAPVVTTPAPTTTPAPQPQLAAVDANQSARTQARLEEPAEQEKTSGWQRPPGARMLHGIRIGYNFISNFEKATREQEDGSMKSIKDEFGLKTPHTMIMGYEAMYRIVGHSWLNVVMVGNVSVAGLEQSKFIPTASGLIGAELNESFQLGVGVNLIPDEKAPTHMIVAAGWTPKIGSIYAPVHFYFVPDPAGNHRSGMTLGVTW